MAGEKNVQLELFRVKIRMLLEQYADRMKVLVTANAAMGMPAGRIRELRETDNNKWAWEKTKLEKAIKQEVAGLINRVHIAAYTEDLK